MWCSILVGALFPLLVWVPPLGLPRQTSKRLTVSWWVAEVEEQESGVVVVVPVP
jgi:hypothetical protein